ncbi:MAG: hypothetical protein WCE63_06225, partial [Acidobacteriaceae bacterium]
KQQRLVDRVSNEVLAHESNLKQNLLRTHSRLRQESMPDTHLDVAFQAVPVKRPLSRGNWYVACRGAMINLQTLDGTIISRTAETPMEFAYKNETSSGWEAGVEVKPTAKVGPEGAEAEVSIFSVTTKKKEKSAGQVDYTGQENTLSVTDYKHSVVWKISMVRGERAISDFLFCKLPLWADCKKESQPLQGTIALLPSVFDFDQDERRMSGMKSFLMQITLAFRKSFENDPEKAPVLNQKGIRLSFGESK